MRKWAILILALWEIKGMAAAPAVGAAEPGESVVVLYNRSMYESKEVAEYYARRRRVPKDHLLGFDLPATETITRAIYQKQLEKPLLAALENKKWIRYQSVKITRDSKATGRTENRVVEASVRYLVLCYGMPLRIAQDTNWVEKGQAEVRVELRGNGAAVDSELAFLPHAKDGYSLMGPIPNPLYTTTNAAELNPTNGVMIVARLDGPSAVIAKQIIDKAIQAETDGLWGKAYFDLRGLTNTAYLLGDEWIRGAAQAAHRYGFETVVDEQPATFPVAFPMAHIALYAGWYDGTVSGPFTRPVVEFMPGAIAYHLHSFSAQTVRSKTAAWVGPLLAKGATATLGCIDEPYLEATPNVAVLFSRLISGFTFGEAALASQKMLSWHITVVGDPLYCPFERGAETQYKALWLRQSSLLPWAQLRVVDLNLARGTPPTELIRYLEENQDTVRSAILLEKLGRLYRQEGKLPQAITCMQRALEQNPSLQQKILLLLNLAKWQRDAEQWPAAFDTGERFLREIPDYPEKVAVYKTQMELAVKLEKKAVADDYERRIKLEGSGKPDQP